MTDTGLGGGGGKAKGRFTQVFVDSGHSLPLYKPSETAEAVAKWLGGAFKAWWDEDERGRNLEAPTDPVNFFQGFLQRMSDNKLYTIGFDTTIAV